LNIILTLNKSCYVQLHKIHFIAASFGSFILRAKWLWPNLKRRYGVQLNQSRAGRYRRLSASKEIQNNLLASLRIFIPQKQNSTHASSVSYPEQPFDFWGKCLD